MRLSEEAFTELVQAGCPRCQKPKLLVRAFVAQRVPLHGGEPYGKPSWAYKGEELVHGTFRITCAACGHDLWADDACPRCDAADGVARALESDTGPAPARCGDCGAELLTATAIVPASVIYEGKRTASARADAILEEAGFHALRVECTRCHLATAPRVTGCALCGDAGQA